MTQIVRQWSPCGPCITCGPLVRETAQFYVFADRFEAGQHSKGKKPRADNPYSSKYHVEPCPSCTDHPRTQYPNGYDN